MPSPRAKWTILTYIAAHNNLDALGKRSRDQIIATGSSPDLQLAVLFDGKTEARRYLVGAPGEPPVEEPLDNFDSGDADALIKTVSWAFAQRPADRYGLILWSHGTGWAPKELKTVATEARGDKAFSTKEATDRSGSFGSYALFRSSLNGILKKATPRERAICFDDGTGHALDTLALERVTAELQTQIGQPLDFLGMDACLMATLEVAYQLRNTTRCLVASEELVPGHSWPYDLILGQLRANPTQTPRELAEQVVRQYVDYYSANPPRKGDVTKVALDLSQIHTLSTATDQLAEALRAGMPAEANSLWSAQLVTKRAETNGRAPTKFQFHLWDLGSLATRLNANIGSSDAVRDAALKVKEALKPGGAVIAEGHYGSWFDGIGGVAIYLPPPGGVPPRRVAPDYASVSLSTDTGWDEMLAGYHLKGKPA